MIRPPILPFPTLPRSPGPSMVSGQLGYKVSESRDYGQYSSAASSLVSHIQTLIGFLNLYPNNWPSTVQTVLIAECPEGTYRGFRWGKEHQFTEKPAHCKVVQGSTRTTLWATRSQEHWIRSLEFGFQSWLFFCLSGTLWDAVILDLSFLIGN